MTVNAASRLADPPERETRAERASLPNARFDMLLKMRISGVIAAVCAALLAQTALADETVAPGSNARPAAHWRGRFCTPFGCTGAPSNPWSVAAGFGAAALAAGWLGRRRERRASRPAAHAANSALRVSISDDRAQARTQRPTTIQRK